jgi:hypothetical protein
MAAALGMGQQALAAYTGEVRVNLKGAEDAAEVQRRMTQAMDDLQFKMLQGAEGFAMARSEFGQFMDSVRGQIDAAGMGTDALADVIVQGMTGRMSAAQVGEQLSEIVLGGIYNTLASPFAAQIAQVFQAQIITPVMTAIMSGVPISQALSQSAINSVVATAQAAASALNAIFKDAGFRQAIGGIQQAISGISGAVASVRVPAFRAAAVQVSAVNEALRERFGLETQLLNLLGNTNKLRERELNGLDASNRALQARIWALEDAKSGLESAFDALERAVAAERDRINTQLESARDLERSLNDVFGLLRDNIRDLRGEVLATNLMQASEARALIARAIGSGVLPDAAILRDAISGARGGLAASQFASATDRDRASLTLANELQRLQAIAQPQLSAAERQVTLLQGQLDALEVQLQVAEDQMNALLGIDDSVQTVTRAVDGLSAAMATYTNAVAAAASISVSASAPVSTPTGGGGGGGGGYRAPTPSRVWTVDGYWAKNPDLRAYYNANAAALNKQFGGVDQYLEWHWNTYGKNENRQFAQGGAFTNGVVTRPTFFDMAQMGEKTPEGVLPLANVGGRLGVHAITGGDAETKALLRDLLAEMKAARAASESGAVASHSMDKRLKRVIRAEDGNERLMVGTPGLAPLPVEAAA